MFRRGARAGAGHVFPTLSTSSVRSGALAYTPSRRIHFTRGTEGIDRTTDPTLQGNIADIRAAEARGEAQTTVLRAGTMSQYDRANRHVYLPLGHDDLVAASHEMQHARDQVALDILPPQEVLERRAFTAQQSTASHLGVSDQLGGQTPSQRAATHSQVKKP